MKNYILTLATATLLTACGPRDGDSVKQAHNENINSSIDEEVSEFLTEAADARMMDLEEGKLAATKGSTQEIRDYGQMMVRDQTKMLTELRVLAASKNITLPNSLSHKKADGLEDLEKKTGDEFDEKFVSMMKIDHKRDVDEFEDATDFKDPDIKLYAETYLPVVKSHLQKIESLEESRDVAKANETPEEDEKAQK